MSSYLNVNSNMVHVTEKGFSRLKQHVIDTEKRYLDVCEQHRVAHDLSGMVGMTIPSLIASSKWKLF